MDWIQVLTIVAANFAMFLWVRSEANSDRRDFMSAIRNMHDNIQEEMKDFHGRLCAIEEREKTRTHGGS